MLTCQRQTAIQHVQLAHELCSSLRVQREVIHIMPLQHMQQLRWEGQATASIYGSQQEAGLVRHKAARWRHTWAFDGRFARLVPLVMK